jgi:hypothetical protein
MIASGAHFGNPLMKRLKMSSSSQSNNRFIHITNDEFWAKGGGRHGKFRNWPKGWPTVNVPNHSGEFLARLWTLYGSPDDVGFEGFTYNLLDNVTGIIFHAYCGSSGPAFGGASAPDEEMEVPMNSLEALLSQTPLADCSIEFPTDFGEYRVGAHDGIAFENEVKKRRKGSE